jgi:hypothetical protein
MDAYNKCFITQTPDGTAHSAMLLATAWKIGFFLMSTTTGWLLEPAPITTQVSFIEDKVSGA